MKKKQSPGIKVLLLVVQLGLVSSLLLTSFDFHIAGDFGVKLVKAD